MRFLCLHICVFPLLQGAYFSLLKTDFKKSDTKLTKEMDTSILRCAYCVLRKGERGIIFWVQTRNSLGESMVGWAENSAIKFRPLSHAYKRRIKKKAFTLLANFRDFACQAYKNPAHCTECQHSRPCLSAKAKLIYPRWISTRAEEMVQNVVIPETTTTRPSAKKIHFIQIIGKKYIH